MGSFDKPVVLFGTGDHPEVLWWYMTRDSGVEVAGFTVDSAYLDCDRFCGLPVVPFEHVTGRFPAAEFDMLVAIGYNGVNRPRRRKFDHAKSLGYRLVNYFHPSTSIPDDLVVGDNCVILCNNVIQPRVSLGSNVHINHNNLVSHHSRIGDDVYITSGVTIGGRAVVEQGCFLGIGCIVRDGVSVGDHCVLGAGSVINGDAESGGIYRPARSIRSTVPSSRLRRL